ncbi:MAG: 16S rRNA (uracil(1498)-N(3))-methyltransferase [Bacteroidia bacterium]|nr:16S rRNA (uracil(1498)-N(3))-methyltransferase [Bacteroidia bacterium]MDW8346810.1 RsmE family RNA methyltransferase [Bacteroidia bacterium]
MELFYTTDIQPPYLFLHGTEAAHCIKVLRKAPQQHIFITNGLGTQYQCIITEIDRKKNIVCAYIEQTQRSEPLTKIGLCVAPTKNTDRMEWLIEKAIELGISQVQWVVTRYSQRESISLERMQRIAIAAMKQSLRCFLPVMHNILPFLSWINNHAVLSGVIGYCGEEIPKAPLCEIKIPPNSHTFWICIGPEGDFTQDEVRVALEKGLSVVSMGSNRLRTETAALAAISYYYLNSAK